MSVISIMLIIPNDTWFNITSNGLKTYQLLRSLTGPQSPKEKTQEFKAVHCFKSRSSGSSQGHISALYVGVIDNHTEERQVRNIKEGQSGSILIMKKKFKMRTGESIE